VAVDPQVSRRKFERELTNFRRIEDYYLSRGIWLLKAEFPQFFFVLATPNANPKMVPYGILVDFTDYDEHPLSVRFVDPFTRKVLSLKEIPGNLYGNRVTHFPRSRQIISPVDGGMRTEIVPLLQAFGENGVPFICLPGVREYHDNPGHSGDSWFLHRRTGEGTLHFILDNLWKYGVEKVQGPGAQIQIVMSGLLSSGLPPE
jgi:Predicted metal binding domain